MKLNTQMAHSGSMDSSHTQVMKSVMKVKNQPKITPGQTGSQSGFYLTEVDQPAFYTMTVFNPKSKFKDSI